jgi:hypothetical protein
VVSVISLGALVSAGPGCADDFDTTRATPVRGSLGREMYTLVCDRVGAQALREDVTGSSYHRVCHPNTAGEFESTTVDAALLPPLDPNAIDVKGEPVAIAEQQQNRAHRVARIEALARRRDDLVAAFDAAFANEQIGTKDLANPDPTKSCGPPLGGSGEAELRTELADMLGRMTDLYNDDTVPHLTRALSRVMTDVDHAPGAQAALARFDARRGYRPTATAMGVARPALSYPRIVELANALLRLLSADTDPLGLAGPPGPKKKPQERTSSDRVPGKAHAALGGLLAAMREELRTSKEIPTPAALVLTADARDPSLVRLNRPRGNLEITRALLLREDATFTTGSAPAWVVRRDARGFAKVALTNGKLPPPFVDLTGPDGKPDGLPDVDDIGRFITANGNGVAPSPFVDVFGEQPGIARDADGRALLGSKPAYEYLDVSRTFLASLAKDIVPLLQPDPKKQHETVMDLLGGFAVVAAARDVDARTERTYREGKTARTVTYRAFREDASPLLDLVHAFGQVLADRQADDTLALFQRLAEEKPEVLARLIGAGLKIKAIADAHPEAKIPASSTLWDELLDVLVAASQKPKLVEDLIRAFADDATLDLPRSAIAYMTMRDELTYDRNNLNGPAFNLTTGTVETLKTPVDRSQPDTGLNRSAFQRFLQALHDTNGMSVCTKRGAVAHVVWEGIAMDFPSFTAQTACFVLGADPPPDTMPMCGILRIKNIADELVNAVLGKVNLDIRDDCLRKLVSSPLTGIVGGADAFLEEVSGIKGFNTKPSVQGINRLVFFDLPHDGSTGDTKNPKTLKFLKDTFDPPPTLVCPAAPFIDKDGTQLNLRQCATFKDSVRGRDSNALFPLEQLGFLEAAKPLARAFNQNESNLLFVDLFEALHRHWGSTSQSKDECDPGMPKTNARWCSQDGAVTYEPLIAEALGTDLFPAIHDVVKELGTIKIAHCDERGAKGECTKQSEWDGVKVLAEAVNDLVDPSKNKGLTRRNGNTSVARNDGTKNAQVTPIYLLIDALKGFDGRLAEHSAKNPNDDRLPSWRRGRSQLVDQLFTVTGTGKASRLENAAIEKMIPVLVSTLRSQLAAHCPDPTKGCDWAKTELSAKMTDVVTGPTFAGVLDVLDAIRADEPARTELERLLVFLLQGGEADASRTTLAALADMLQLFEDDGNMTALLRAVAEAAGPEVLDDDRNVASRGLLLAAIEVMSRILGEVHDDGGQRLCSKEIDPNRTLAVVLRRLVTPQQNGKAAPIEVLIDVVADVNRAHPEETKKLEAADYGSIARELSDFCANPSRGLEQVYTVIKQATKDL